LTHSGAELKSSSPKRRQSRAVITSNAMTDHKVENIDSEDAGDLLVKIEKSFDIKFGDTELMHIKTLGELCDHIINKIQLDNSDDCTTQQAFYKLRDAITTLFSVDNKTITTDFPLDNFFPRQNRKEKIQALEEYLDVRLKILRPPHWLTNSLLILLLASIVGLFLNWKIGLSGLCISFGGLWLSNKMGKELDVQTVGQLAEKMTRENYLKSRRNPKTVNKNEIEKLLTEWFINDLGLDKSKLTREAKFV
jgi:acyl carrier protein